MEKRELEERIGKSVSDADYGIIETVYQWHPLIRNTSGKDEVTELYERFGITIFLDMLPRAEKAFELEGRLRCVQAEENRIKEEIRDLFFLGFGQWSMPAAEHLEPLVKWTRTKVVDGCFSLNGNVYQDEKLKGCSHVTVAEYEKQLTVFDDNGDFITEIKKNGRMK